MKCVLLAVGMSKIYNYDNNFECRIPNFEIIKNIKFLMRGGDYLCRITASYYILKINKCLH